MRIPLHVVCAISIVCLPFVTGVIESVNFPPDMQACYRRFSAKTTISQTVAEAINWYCIGQYMWKTASQRWTGRNITSQTYEFVGGLLNTFIDTQPGRVRRQAGQGAGNSGGGQGAGSPGGGPPRLRQEYRMMSERERADYHSAIQVAKADTSVEPNAYDALAEFHTGIVAVSAHGGCNFLGWHRVYLWMYESLLRRAVPSVSLPYWDSRMDDLMENSAQSILWTDGFLGNGDGIVTTGPFANWTTPAGPLTRNVGSGGPLFTHESIINVTAQTRMADICGGGASVENDLEFHHGGAHRYVDGQMGMIETASYEPVFWMHHAFVDFVWEVFRSNQRRAGNDPFTEYPSDFGNPLHAPDQEMGFGSLRNIDGLTDTYRAEYAPAPTCRGQGQGRFPCGSPYLRCDTSGPGPRCVGMTLDEYIMNQQRPPTVPRPGVPGTFPPTDVTIPGNPGGNPGNPGGTPGNPWPGGNPGGNPGNPGGNPGNPGWNPGNPGGNPSNPGPGTGGGQFCPNMPLRSAPVALKPHQNTFCVNGKSDTNEWVYVPVKVISQRPPEFSDYHSYPVKNGRASRFSDIYAANSYDNINRYIKYGNPKAYPKCQKGKTGAGEVYIQSDGINYHGSYKEYAIVDHRLAISISVAYIAVKNPRFGQSEAIVNAHDSCGRVCHAACRVPMSNPPVYKPCSGAIRLTSKMPRLYGNNYGDAVLDVWDFKADLTCPHFVPDNFYLAFYCDYRETWPWEVNPGQLPSGGPLPIVSVPKPGPIIPQVPPKVKPSTVPGCDVGRGCVVFGTCDTCRQNAQLMCKDSCSTYARCFYGKYYVQKCPKFHRYNVLTSQCVPGHCTDSGAAWWNQTPGQRGPMRRKGPAGRVGR